jgi:hypothetical protein
MSLLTSIVWLSGAVYIQYQCYPGAAALKSLTNYYSPLIELYHAPEPFIHIDRYAAGTGITRFQETIPGWMYSKDESMQDMTMFTHLITTQKEVEGFNLVD